MVATDSDTLCGLLREQLGLFGYQWLCACAVYPVLRLSLTAHLGNELARAVHRALPDEADFLALCQLAWFRKGWMPEDLRRRLIDDLAPEHRNTVRIAIEMYLFSGFNQPTRATERPIAMELARPPGTWGSIVRAGLERTAAEADGIMDELFLRFMLRHRATPGELRLNWRLTRLLGRRFVSAVDHRTLVGFVVAIGLTAGIWAAVDPVEGRSFLIRFSTQFVSLVRRILFSRLLTHSPLVALILAPLITIVGSFVLGSARSEEGSRRFNTGATIVIAGVLAWVGGAWFMGLWWGFIVGGAVLLLWLAIYIGTTPTYLDPI